ncbi:MAG: AbrB/MazE/SpoVT family DNA-binding domain-containing protein [Candidatus Sungbacteria bacterium]|nr:AbrB/MazE/SpoVT family DNA-binding domain-containing protein [Candidatus Sungbacteria bacterium]
MTQKVLKVGSSMALTVPKKLAEELGWRAGDSVAVKGDPKQHRVIYYSPRKPLSGNDQRIAELGYRFIQNYRRDLESLAKK